MPETVNGLEITMNKFFDNTDIVREIPYSMGKKLKTTQYVNMSKADRDYLRYMYSMLWGHVYDNRVTGTAIASAMYDQMFVVEQTELPRPTKVKNRRLNTWGTFLQGVEHNFLYENTQDFTVKQLPHIVKIVNIAVEYFSVAYPDFEANTEVHKVKAVRI